MIARTERPDFAVLVLVQAFAEDGLVVEVRTGLEPKQVGVPKPLVERLHRPQRRAVRPRFEQLGDPEV